eukprot:2194125-Rhodomonas_salina.1
MEQHRGAMRARRSSRPLPGTVLYLPMRLLSYPFLSAYALARPCPECPVQRVPILIPDSDLGFCYYQGGFFTALVDKTPLNTNFKVPTGLTRSSEPQFVDAPQFLVLTSFSAYLLVLANDVSGTYIMYCLRTDIGCGELSLDACAMSGTDLSYGLLWPFALAMGCPVESFGMHMNMDGSGMAPYAMSGTHIRYVSAIGLCASYAMSGTWAGVRYALHQIHEEHALALRHLCSPDALSDTEIASSYALRTQCPVLKYRISGQCFAESRLSLSWIAAR